MSEQSPWEAFITVDRILILHKQGLEKYGGPDGLREGAECIEGAVGNAWSASLYQEPDEAMSGLAFVGYLLIYLAMAHCFIDGNKRVAWETAINVLGAKRLTLSATEDEAYEFMLSIIEHHLDHDEVVDWIALRLEWIH